MELKSATDTAPPHPQEVKGQSWDQRHSWVTDRKQNKMHIVIAAVIVNANTNMLLVWYLSSTGWFALSRFIYTVETHKTISLLT